MGNHAVVAVNEVVRPRNEHVQCRRCARHGGWRRQRAALRQHASNQGVDVATLDGAGVQTPEDAVPLFLPKALAFVENNDGIDGLQDVTDTRNHEACATSVVGSGDVVRVEPAAAVTQHVGRRELAHVSAPTHRDVCIHCVLITSKFGNDTTHDVVHRSRYHGHLINHDKAAGRPSSNALLAALYSGLRSLVEVDVDAEKAVHRLCTQERRRAPRWSTKLHGVLCWQSQHCVELFHKEPQRSEDLALPRASTPQ